MTLISRWEMLASETKRKYFDISAQILTSTWHKNVGWDNITTSCKKIDWDIHHKSLMVDLFFCSCLKEQTQFLFQHFGSFIGTLKKIIKASSFSADKIVSSNDANSLSQSPIITFLEALWVIWDIYVLCKFKAENAYNNWHGSQTQYQNC